MRSNIGHQAHALLLVAAVPLLVGIDCEGRESLGGDDASTGVDAGPFAPLVDAGDGADAASPPDAGTTTPDAGVAIVDFTEAAHVCGMMGSCLHGQVWLDPCIVGAMYGSSAAEYRAATQGRASTFLTGDLLFSTTTDEPGFLPFRDAPLSLPGLAAEPAFRACVMAATTCEDVYTCLNEGVTATMCTPGPGTSRCDGGTLRGCVYSDVYLDGLPLELMGREPRSFAVDCAAQGNVCVDTVAGGRRVHGCGPAVCDPETFAPHCEGTTAVNCHQGVLDRTVCASGCGVVGDDARCVGGGASCDPATTPAHCEGATLLRCNEGRLERVGCGAAPGMACFTRGASAYCGYSDECGVDESTSCVGTSLRRCVLGRYVDIDCATLGFSRCQTALGRDGYCE